MTETTKSAMITAVTCHIWHENENIAHMVDLEQYETLDDAKADAKEDALGNFASDLSEAHRIWFTVAPMPRPKLRETTVTVILPPEPEDEPIQVTAA